MSLRIMVVDDQPKFSMRVRSLAIPCGHMVLAFEDYEAAARRSESQGFDAAFVGMKLPEHGEFDLVRRLRHSDRNANAIIVMLNATEDIASLRQAFGEGADLVLERSVSSNRLRRMLAAMELPEWKAKRHAARLPLFSEVTCAWNGRQFSLHSMNISESGMLLQPAVDAGVGEQVGLEFKIPEVGASLNLLGQIVRKEGTGRMGVSFENLQPEAKNAIHLYVTGRMKDPERPRGSADARPRRMFEPQ